MAEYENPTVTFYPHESEFEVTPEIPGPSTAERLTEYNDRLKESLANGIRFTEVFDTLIGTADLDELQEAVETLASYRLDGDYLVYPVQYSRADFYLIFVSRLLSIHDRETVVLQSSEGKQSLYHEFPGVNGNGRFVFELDPADERRAFYTERENGLRLFAIDFAERTLHFNSRDIVKLLIVEYDGKVDSESLKRFEDFLVAVGECVEHDYGYFVDFNLLNARREAFYPLVSRTEPEVALDRLFVMGSDAGYMLEAGMNGEAVMPLADGVMLTLFDRNLAGGNAAEWVMTVTDADDSVSFFDLLVRYDFLRDWYLENIASVEVISDSCFAGREGEA